MESRRRSDCRPEAARLPAVNWLFEPRGDLYGKVSPPVNPARVARLAAGGMLREGRRENSEGKGGGHFYSADQQGWAGSEELGEESPGWPRKCLTVPRKLLPVSRWRFITPRQPAVKAVGAARYSRFVTCYPWPVLLRQACGGRKNCLASPQRGIWPPVGPIAISRRLPQPVSEGDSACS